MQREIDSLKWNERDLKQQIENLKNEILDLKSSNLALNGRNEPALKNEKGFNQ